MSTNVIFHLPVLPISYSQIKTYPLAECVYLCLLYACLKFERVSLYSAISRLLFVLLTSNRFVLHVKGWEILGNPGDWSNTDAAGGLMNALLGSAWIPSHLTQSIFHAFTNKRLQCVCTSPLTGNKIWIYLSGISCCLHVSSPIAEPIRLRLFYA